MSIDRGELAVGAVLARRTSSASAASGATARSSRGGVDRRREGSARLSRRTSRTSAAGPFSDRRTSRSSARRTSTGRSKRAAARCRRGASGSQGALDDQQINDIVALPRRHQVGERAVRGQRVPEPGRADRPPSSSTSTATGETGPDTRGIRRCAPSSCLGLRRSTAAPCQGRRRHDHGVHPVRRERVLLLAAVFGRWMGYLVLIGRVLRLDDPAVVACGCSASARRASTRPSNLGPRGAEPAWVPLEAADRPSTATATRPSAT